MGQDVLRAILHDIAAEAAPTPLADRALRGAVRRRRAKVWAGAAAVAGVLAVAPFLLPADGQGKPDRGVPASDVSVAPSPTVPAVTNSPAQPTRTEDVGPSRTATSRPATSPTPPIATSPAPTGSASTGSAAPTGSAEPTSGTAGSPTAPAPTTASSAVTTER